MMMMMISASWGSVALQSSLTQVPILRYSGRSMEAGCWLTCDWLLIEINLGNLEWIRFQTCYCPLKRYTSEAKAIKKAHVSVVFLSWHSRPAMQGLLHQSTGQEMLEQSTASCVQFAMCFLDKIHGICLNVDTGIEAGYVGVILVNPWSSSWDSSKLVNIKDVVRVYELERATACSFDVSLHPG